MLVFCDNIGIILSYFTCFVYFIIWKFDSIRYNPVFV